MISAEMTFLNSKFLTYDPATKIASADFSKFSASRVVFLNDSGTTSVQHNLCRELLATCATGPSCLLLGRVPDKMEFAPAEIPGWNCLPDHVHIEGADSRQKASKKNMLAFLQLEAQRISLNQRRLFQYNQAIQRIAQVLKENSWYTTKEGNIRVGLEAYASINSIYFYDDWVQQDKELKAKLAEIETITDGIRLEEWVEIEPESRNQHLLARISQLSTRFLKIFVLWENDLLEADTELYQKLYERHLEPIVLTPNEVYSVEIDEELDWADGLAKRQILTVETVWQHHDKAFNEKKGIYQPADEIEEFSIGVIQRWIENFPPGTFQSIRQGPLPYPLL